MTKNEEIVPAAERYQKTVFAYLPTWASSSFVIPWSKITHLAFFDVELNSSGDVIENSDLEAWRSGGSALVADGHAAGVKVVLCATLFDTSASDPNNKIRIFFLRKIFSF